MSLCSAGGGVGCMCAQWEAARRNLGGFSLLSVGEWAGRCVARADREVSAAAGG